MAGNLIERSFVVADGEPAPKDGLHVRVHEVWFHGERDWVLEKTIRGGTVFVPINRGYVYSTLEEAAGAVVRAR